MNTDILEKIGIEKKQATIYISLLKMGTSSANEISKQTKIERTLVYRMLEKMIESGLATFVIENKIKKFSAAEPEKLLVELKEKEEELRNSLKELKTISKAAEEPKIEIYKGAKGIKNMIREILIMKQDYLVMGGVGVFSNSMPFFSEYLMKKLEELKIKERVLVNDNPELRIKSRNTVIRVLPKGYFFPATFGVSGNKIGMIVWTDPFMGIRIENDDLAKSFRNNFELLWKISKKI